MAIVIRPATAKDAAALADIYGWHVLNGAGTFEETPPDAAEMARRVAAVQARDLPYMVAEQEGEVLAFAYASPFRLRASYRYTAEDSVYVHHDRVGTGLGRQVLEPVIAACKARGIHQLIALIGGADNAASIALHRSLDFHLLAVLPRLGCKDGKFVDVVWMQRELGPPIGNGLALEG